jgi:site-specific DNA recombinase
VGHLRKAAEGQFLLTRPEATGAAALAERAVALAHQIETDLGAVGKIIAAGTLGKGHLTLKLDPVAIATALDVPADALSDRLLTIARPFDLRRRGVETRIIAGEMIPAPDPVLQRTLAEAHLWAGLIRNGTPLIDVARKTGQSEPYIRNRIVLAFLAPKIQAAILDGKQPPDLSLAKLLREGIPVDWDEQQKLLGVA